MFGYVKKKYYLVRYQVILNDGDVYRDGQSYVKAKNKKQALDIFFRKNKLLKRENIKIVSIDKLELLEDTHPYVFYEMYCKKRQTEELIMCTIDDFSPCVNCVNRICGLVDGSECDKFQAFNRIKQHFSDTEKELAVTREYIHSQNLEWDLLSFSNRKDY